MEAGAVPPDDVEAGIAAGYLKPSLASFVHLAPDRRTAECDAEAARELALARLEIARLERSIDQMRGSREWRVGSSVTGAVETSRRLLQRARSALGRPSNP